MSKSGVKRTAQNNTHVADPKPGKKKSSNASSSSATNNETKQEDKKKSGLTKMFQRVWSEEDEHAILKGMAEFISKTGQEPYRYAEAFHNFVKKSLHAEASIMQLKEKIRRMKKKFETNSRRGKIGKDPRFSKPLDQIAYELGKKVWGEEAHGLVEKPKPIGKKVANTPKKEDATSKNVSIPETKTHPEELEPEPEPERMEYYLLLYYVESLSKFRTSIDSTTNQS
ncbi:putative transcription factor, partial [Mucuna pruriens]